MEARSWPVLALLGPTGIGKTDMALRLAAAWPLEVVNADSRQIYRGMDIGTAKPTRQQRADVTHHLYDVCDPDQTLTLAEYQAMAQDCIRDIRARRRVPVLVGGTPLYLRAILENLRIPDVAPDPVLRQELETILAAQGPEALFARLVALDPVTAQTIDARNGRRLVRALEVFIKTGQSKARLEGRQAPEWPICCIGLTCTRTLLHARVDARVNAMMTGGLVTEVQSLLEAGYDCALPALSALGYRQLVPYLQGEQTREEAVQRIKTATHRYIRHQYTWFRRWQNVRWFEMDFVDPAGMTEQIRTFVGQAWLAPAGN